MTERPPPFGQAFGIDVTQAEADFVIPNLTTDIPVCIDPFLLYKSRDPQLLDLHDRLLAVFGRAFELHDAGDRAGLDRLINFPEVNAIGFGYTQGRIAGSGLGWQLNQLLADLLETSEVIRERGLRHVEELQLLSVGVGPDRVSDITANVLKLALVEYTQQQCELWRIPLASSVPLPHYLDHAELEWRDGYFDLPVNPLSGVPLILVPRRMVRLLPWINYDDFYSKEAQLLLPPRPRLPRGWRDKNGSSSRRRRWSRRFGRTRPFLAGTSRERNKSQAPLSHSCTTSLTLRVCERRETLCSPVLPGCRLARLRQRTTSCSSTRSSTSCSNPT
jgi:hypothetical protein